MSRCHKLVLASGNPHKLVELRSALPGWEIEPVVTEGEPPHEDGTTFEENARIKARWGRRHAPPDAWAMGEDSGIEAAALGGAPGVLTARWAAGDPVGRMLQALEGEDARQARYVCALVAIDPDGRELVARGTLAGTIARVASGSEGFGFDPVFVPRGQDRTFAAMEAAEKATSSHRGQAVRAFLAFLEKSTKA